MFEYEVEKVVVGFFKNMNNIIGFCVESFKIYVEVFELRIGFFVVFWDECLIIFVVERILIEVDVLCKK